MQCGLKNFIYLGNSNKIRTDLSVNKKNSRPVGFTSQIDKLELSFKAEPHDIFLSQLADLLSDPNTRNIDEIQKLVEKSTKKPFKPILDSNETINQLLINTYNKNNIDINAEKEKIAEKVLGNKICLTHENFENMFSMYRGVSDRCEKNTREPNNDEVGRVFEDIGASVVKKELFEPISEKIAKEENSKEENIKKGKIVSPEEIKSQLRLLNRVKFTKAHLAEFDHMIIWVKEQDPSKRICENFEVVGIVETKYNPARVGYGFDRRIEDISWLKNQQYDKDKYFYEFKTKTICDKDNDFCYKFTPSSFKRFSTGKNDEHTLENLYFVTSNYPLASLNEKLAKMAIESGKKLYSLNFSFKNEFNDDQKEIFRKYLKSGKSDHIKFVNDDYCGFSLLSTTLYKKIRNMSKKNGFSFNPEYINIDINNL